MPYQADLQLSGKSVIVTGAARGIGEAIAEAFGSAKCRILLADRMKRPDGRKRIEALANRIGEAGGDAFVMQVDISNKTQVEGMIKTAVEKFDRIDILVNNAAIIKFGTILDTDEQNLQQHLDINVKGSFYCCQAAARQMVKQGGGKIIILSSIDGMQANEGEIAYSATKAALILMMKCMAVDLAPHKINVNAIAPGWIATDMSLPYLQQSEAVLKECLKHIPLGYVGKPEDVAGAALFLASHLSDFITGHVLVVDGGQTSNITIKA